jgi:hypothetical protein
MNYEILTFFLLPASWEAAAGQIKGLGGFLFLVGKVGLDELLITYMLSFMLQ